MGKKQIFKFILGSLAAFCMIAGSSVVSHAAIVGTYPSTEGGVETISSASGLETFLSFDGIIFQGKLNIEQSVDLAGANKEWTFNDGGGTASNTSVVFERDFQTNGGVVTVIPNLTSGSAYADDDTSSITYSSIIVFQNPNYYPLSSDIGSMFVMDETYAAEGWSLEPYTNTYNGVDKVEYINIVYTPIVEEEEEEVIVDNGPDDGGGGGCNMGMTPWLFLFALIPATGWVRSKL